MLNRTAQISIEQVDNGFVVATPGKRLVVMKESDVAASVQEVTAFILSQQPAPRPGAAPARPPGK